MPTYPKIHVILKRKKFGKCPSQSLFSLKSRLIGHFSTFLSDKYVLAFFFFPSKRGEMMFFSLIASFYRSLFQVFWSIISVFLFLFSWNTGKKCRKISEISQSQSNYRPKISKKMSIICRNLRGNRHFGWLGWGVLFQDWRGEHFPCLLPRSSWITRR